MNRDLQQYLHLFTVEKQHEWVDWLPIVQFSYNTKKQASTQKSPFEVTWFYSPRMGFDVISIDFAQVQLWTFGLGLCFHIRLSILYLL